MRHDTVTVFHCFVFANLEDQNPRKDIRVSRVLGACLAASAWPGQSRTAAAGPRPGGALLSGQASGLWAYGFCHHCF